MQEPLAAPAPSIRSLTLSVFMPAFLFAVGQGAVIPILPLVAEDLGSTVAVAGLIVALRGIGQMVFDIPAGSLVSRFGERTTMIIGTVILIVGSLGSALSPNPLVLTFFVFVMGCAWSVWLLARLSYVSDVMPAHLRGRALSTLGGVNRIGNFVGPFLGAAVIGIGGLDSAFHLQILFAAIGLATLLFAPEPVGGTTHAVHGPVPFVSVVREHSHTYLTAGLGATAISVLRASRQVIIPLWGIKIGLDASQVSLIFGISNAMDMALFYPSGAVSDRMGRRWVSIPCLVVLSAGLILLPLSNSFETLLLVGLLVGAGNGLGTGIVMIMGADFSPQRGRAEFLGVWRLVSDMGQAGGPLLVAAATAALSLGFASVAVGAVGLAGAALVTLTVPETLPNRRAVAGPPVAATAATVDEA